MYLNDQIVDETYSLSGYDAGVAPGEVSFDQMSRTMVSHTNKHLTNKNVKQTHM